MSILAFVHIEKTAGTTFIHLLRKNFFPGYMDVRPVVPHGRGNLTAGDMRVLSRINPLLRCIAGHSVQSCSDLDQWRPDLRFVTILRDPIARYISQFNYWNRRLGKNVKFNEFLANAETWNFQTRKIAGRNDLELAKSELRDRFFHVGIVEEFDEFLLMLRRKLQPMSFDITYSVKNAGGEQSDAYRLLAERFCDEISAVNELDLSLYSFVKETLLPVYRSQFGANLHIELRELCESKIRFIDRSYRLYLDYAIRKLYYQPVTGIIRRYNGLPYRGSYETR